MHAHDDTPPSSLETTRKPLTPLEIMAKPAISFEEFFIILLGLPRTTADELIRAGDGPPMFLLGRRRYVLRDDGIAWLEAHAEANRHFRRINKPRKTRREG